MGYSAFAERPWFESLRSWNEDRGTGTTEERLWEVQVEQVQAWRLLSLLIGLKGFGEDWR